MNEFIKHNISKMDEGGLQAAVTAVARGGGLKNQDLFS
jgi:hypothetical protein